TATGVEVVTYIPSNAYLVYGDSASLRRVRRLTEGSSSFVQWQGPYVDTYLIDPGVLQSQTEREKQQSQPLKTAHITNGPLADGKSGAGLFQLQLFKDPNANARTRTLIDQVKIDDVKVEWEILSYVNLVVGLSEDGVKELAQRPDVVAILQHETPRKLDERQNMIVSGNLTGGTGGTTPVTGLSWFTYLTNVCITQTQFYISNFVVNISDSGIDNANPANPNHFAFHRSGDLTLASRLVYARLVGTPNGGSTLQGCDGHGTENGSI